jgi:hypothetical protein
MTGVFMGSSNRAVGIVGNYVVFFEASRSALESFLPPIQLVSEAKEATA